MFNKGFTIFELLIIILVLSLLGCFGLVSVFNTMRANRECKYESMKEQIIDAAKIYVEANNELSNELNTVGYLNIKLGELQDAGFIDRNLRNPY